MIVPDKLKSNLKPRREARPNGLKKREVKAVEKAVRRENPEKGRPDALLDKKKKVKKPRKPTGQFRELPKD